MHWRAVGEPWRLLTLGLGFGIQGHQGLMCPCCNLPAGDQGDGGVADVHEGASVTEKDVKTDELHKDKTTTPADKVHIAILM